MRHFHYNVFWIIANMFSVVSLYPRIRAMATHDDLLNNCEAMICNGVLGPFKICLTALMNAGHNACSC